MKILGLQNWASHDSAACILSDEGDTDILRFVTCAEERFLRVKNSYQFPIHALVECMERIGIECLREIDYLVTDFSKIPRWINSGPHYRKLLHDYIKLHLDVPEDRVLIIRHHDSHAANAYYPSHFADAAILVVDGLGSESETISLYKGEGTRIQFLERASDYGPGMLYEAVTGLLGFGGNNGVQQPGKTMGLAPYGEYQPGPILNIQGKYDRLRIDYSHFISRLPFPKLKQKLIPCENKEDVTNPYYSRIAFEVQEEIEVAMTHLARYALERTGSRNLVISGGVGLNCVANGRLLEAIELDGFYVQPVCSDEGFELGAALYAYYNILSPEKPKRFYMPTAYTGRTYERAAIRKLLKRLCLPSQEIAPAGVAEKIAAQQIVGWFVGGSEGGPRALGHRSILADPRAPNMKDILNHRVKHREPFRPFAPSVLEEYAGEFFELNCPSPYMLLARPVREDKKALIPAVVHVDGSSRIQTVSREYGGAYYEVIDEFRKITGIPLVLDTSFNDNNEPIVETPEDALITFLSTEIDVLYLEGLMIEKERLETETIAGIVGMLKKERQERQERIFQRFLQRCCRDWNPSEIAQYHSLELIRALWHRKFEAIEHLEQAVEEAVCQKQSVYLVGTRDHTKLLYERIPQFSRLNIVGVTYLGRQDWEDVIFAAYEGVENTLTEPDVVFIASYEFQEEAEQLARVRFGSDVEIVHFYRLWSEDPRFVLSPEAGSTSEVFPYPGDRIFWGKSSLLGFRDIQDS